MDAENSAVLTKTTRRKIVRAIQGRKEISTIALASIANRYQVPEKSVKTVADQMSVRIVEVAQPPPKPKPKPKVATSLSDAHKRTIVSGRLYSLLYPESDFVVINKATFLREREAIIRWIKELGGKLP